jgi:hypothetical protein
MAKKKKQMKTEQEKQETVKDPYTGEEKPIIPNTGQFIEVVPREADDRKGQNYLLNEETGMDAYAADADADAAAEQAASFTEDKDIEDEFAARQGLAASGRKVLEEDLDEHHSKSPELSGGDIDAAWQQADQAGEETVGGSVPTPDQDQVDELGKAAGLTYQDDEPLNTEEKLAKRDRQRWELNPASSLEENQDLLDRDEDEEIRQRERRLMEDDD